MKLFVTIEFIFIGLLFIGLAIPMIFRRVPPNHIYGFRVRKTLENPDIWYKANEYAGKALVRAGIVIVVGAVVFALIPGIKESAYVGINVAVMSISGLTALVLSLMYLRTL